VLESFQRLAASGNVELICETYYHSLAFIYSPSEFRAQVEQQARMLHDVFGQRPKAFRNTELIYNNDVAHRVFEIGYDTILCEGADHLLGYRSPGFVYRPPGRPEVRLLLKHYRLSDDIAFRFGNRAWKEWPLTADKFAHWVDQMGLDGQTVNLFMDYETFGEHQWAETGIFDFFYHLPEFVLKYPHNDFRTPSHVANSYWSVGDYDVPNLTSWADTERDLTAWLGNSMQTHAAEEIYKLEAAVLKTGDERLLDDWRKLQTSDHFYYMCTKYFADGDVHKYFSPYDSPYDSYINFMNVLDNLRHRLGQ
jgi:alpha-amylase